MSGVLTVSRTGCHSPAQKKAGRKRARWAPTASPLPRSSSSFCVFFKISRVHSVTSHVRLRASCQTWETTVLMTQPLPAGHPTREADGTQACAW